MSNQRHDQFLVDSREQIMVAAELAAEVGCPLRRVSLVDGRRDPLGQNVLSMIPTRKSRSGQLATQDSGTLAWVQVGGELTEVEPEYFSGSRGWVSKGQVVGSVVKLLGNPEEYTVYIISFSDTHRVGEERQAWAEVQAYHFGRK